MFDPACRRQAHDVVIRPRLRAPVRVAFTGTLSAVARAVRGGPAWCLPAALGRRGADGESRRGVIVARSWTAGNRKLTHAAADPDLLPSA